MPWLIVAAVSGLLAVALGAYGWHSLAADDALRAIFLMGVQYQMWHALALIAVAWLASRGAGAQSGGTPAAGTAARGPRLVHLSGLAFVLGTVLFSGSLYAMGVTGTVPVSGAAPLGDGFLMGGWALLGLAAWQARPAT